MCVSYFSNTVYLISVCDNSNPLTHEPRKGAKSNTFTCQLCDLFRFVTNALKKALFFQEEIECVYLSANRFSMPWENGIEVPLPFFVSAWHWKTDLNFAFCFSFSPNFEKRIWPLYFVFASLRKTGEGKRKNVFAEWHVAWLAEWHNYAEWIICRMT